MLKSLLPKAHRKYLAMPLLGPVVDGFENWLTSNGYTSGSRKFAIRMLRHVDADLRRRQVRKVTSLTHATLHTCWRHLIRSFPNNAGTVRTLERYLTATGTIAAADVAAMTTSAAAVLSEEYANHLREVRGFAASSISHHRYAARCFINHLESRKVPVDSIQPQDVEAYINKAGKRLSRASLQHEVAAARGFLRFLAAHGRAPVGLDRKSTRHACTAWNNCLAPSRGIQ